MQNRKYWTVRLFKDNINLFLFTQIAVLNETLLKMSHMLHSPNSKMSLSKTVNALKKGMADTGAEMTKLSDEIKQIGEATSSQSKAVRRIFLGLFNISVSVNIILYNTDIKYNTLCNF